MNWVRPYQGQIGTTRPASKKGLEHYRKLMHHDDGNRENISSNENVFKEAIPPFQNALKDAGYDFELKYELT